LRGLISYMLTFYLRALRKEGLQNTTSDDVCMAK